MINDFSEYNQGQIDEIESSIRMTVDNDGNLHLPTLRGFTLNEIRPYINPPGENRFSTPMYYLTGNAGCGKTYSIKQRIAQDPLYGRLAATTGIAAVNLGAATLNAVLKFGDVQSITDAFVGGYLQKQVAQLKETGFQFLIIDEVSMLHRTVFEHIVMAFDEVNERKPDEMPIGIIFTGDFAQLPPVPNKLIVNGKPVVKNGREINEPTPWIFESPDWVERIEGKHPNCQNVARLTKCWRQDDEKFLEAIMAIRRGVGSFGAQMLKDLGVKFVTSTDQHFDGTTILAKNDEVERFNQVALKRIDQPSVHLRSARWCARQYEPSEWKNIPSSLELKEGAYVMILTNDTINYSYANGDCGHIVGFLRNGESAMGPDSLDTEFGNIFDTEAEDDDPFGLKEETSKVLSEPDESYNVFTHASSLNTITRVAIRLERNNEIVTVPMIVRNVEQRAEPDENEKRDKRVHEIYVGPTRRKLHVLGQVCFFPIRLAYATTVHKSQGLTLPKLQIDLRGYFFGSPQMVYVAASRKAGGPENLIIVGDPKLLAERVKIDQKVRKYL